MAEIIGNIYDPEWTCKGQSPFDIRGEFNGVKFVLGPDHWIELDKDTGWPFCLSPEHAEEIGVEYVIRNKNYIYKKTTWEKIAPKKDNGRG